MSCARTCPSPQHRNSGPTGVASFAGHLTPVLGILRERLAAPLALSALAQEAHLSRSQLVRALDATVGMSPTTYLRQMRAAPVRIIRAVI
jgi:AraC-like DNA-binding protein